jgi:hypothetical protein
MADEVLETGLESEVEQLETGAEVEGAESGAETEATEQTAESTEPTSAASTWKQVKERLKDAPDLHRQVKKALHFMEDAQKRLPDGIAKVQERLELVSQLDDNPEDPEYVPGSTPIEDVISNTLAERGFWRDYDNAFQAGDRKVINQMIEANPASFQKLVPEAMDEYAQINPDGFSTYICKSVAGYLNNAQIPLQLALLERVLPPDSDDPGLKTVIEAFKAIKGVISTIDATAKNKIEVKNGNQVTPAAQTGDNLESRELNILHDEWLREIRPRSENFAVSEVQRIAPKTKFTPSEVAKIQSAIKQEINARVAVNDGYQKKIKSLLKAKNKTAYAMTVESEHKKIIPGAAKRAVDDVLAKRKALGAKKPNGSAQQSTNGQQAASTQQNGNQYEWIADSPARLGLKIDFRRGGIQPDNTAFIVGRVKPVKWTPKKR